MSTIGVVKHWELIVRDEQGEHVTKHHNYEFGVDAFKTATAANPAYAALFACSGKYGSHRIKTWELQR